MKKLTREDLTDILYGCAVLGTGGGGSLDEGLAMIDEALAAGREFTLTSPRWTPARLSARPTPAAR